MEHFFQSSFGDIYSEIRIFFSKLYSPIGLTYNKYCDIFSDNMIKANELISNIFNNKTYDGKTAADDINIICEGFNNYLLKKKTNKPFFMNVGYIFHKPLKDLKYFYKSINLNILPFMVSYTNESLYCLFVLFAIDN